MREMIRQAKTVLSCTRSKFYPGWKIHPPCNAKANVQLTYYVLDDPTPFFSMEGCVSVVLFPVKR